jgi:hypothetical protein
VARDLNAAGIPSDDVRIADGAGAEGHEWSQRNIAAVGGLSFGWFIAGLIPLVAKRTFGAAAGIGASLGALAGFIAGLCALAIRGGTPLIAGSGVLTVFATLCIGAAFGALIAGLYNMGVSHEEIPLRSEAVRENAVVVAAHVDSPRAPDALRVMTEHGASSLRADVDAWKASGWDGAHIKDEPYPSDSSVRKHEPGN